MFQTFGLLKRARSNRILLATGLIVFVPGLHLPLVNPCILNYACRLSAHFLLALLPALLPATLPALLDLFAALRALSWESWSSVGGLSGMSLSALAFSTSRGVSQMKRP